MAGAHGNMHPAADDIVPVLVYVLIKVNNNNNYNYCFINDLN